MRQIVLSKLPRIDCRTSWQSRKSAWVDHLWPLAIFPPPALSDSRLFPLAKLLPNIGRQTTTRSAGPRKLRRECAANTKFGLLTSGVPRRNPQASISNPASTSAWRPVPGGRLNGRSDRKARAGSTEKPPPRGWASASVVAPSSNGTLHKMHLILCARCSKRRREMQFGVSCADSPWESSICEQENQRPRFIRAAVPALPSLT